MIYDVFLIICGILAIVVLIEFIITILFSYKIDCEYLLPTIITVMFVVLGIVGIVSWIVRLFIY